MARPVYRYNPETCRFEPCIETGRSLLTKTAVFLSVAITLSVIVFIFYSSSFPSFEETVLKQENKSLHTAWYLLEKRAEKVNRDLAELIEKDDRTYRVILDTPPLAPSVREAGTGGSEKVTIGDAAQYPVIYSTYKRIGKLKRQLDVEGQSFEEIESILHERMNIWSSRPAIQPIDNRQLDRLHLTYGPRFHPLHKVVMDHKGLDFSAPEGTPVYATGDGKIGMAYFSVTYGKVIFVDHGHGFETRYAHLSKFAVNQGEAVKRGQVIGYVGNTGTSIAAHLHYEVLINGQHTNPINFFQRDFGNEEYQRLIEEAGNKTTPLDFGK